MLDDRLTEMLGRAAALKFALGSIIRHMPEDARQSVQDDLRLLPERSDIKHDYGKHLAEAARSILKESGDRTASS